MLEMYEDKRRNLACLGHVQACDMADRNRETGFVEALIRFFGCRRFCTVLVPKEDLFMEAGNALLRVHSYRTEGRFCSEGGSKLRVAGLRLVEIETVGLWRRGLRAIDRGYGFIKRERSSS